jgi:hypothetical protein
MVKRGDVGAITRLALPDAAFGALCFLRLDPRFHVVGVVEHGLAQLEGTRAFSPVPPPSQGGYGNAGLVGYFGGAK